MSHHGESLLARDHPQLDLCDSFVLGSDRGGTVGIQTFCPESGPKGFDPRGQYNWHADLNGDARADRSFRVTFGPAESDGQQPLRLAIFDGEDGTDPDADGRVLAEGRTGTVTDAGPARVYAGRVWDPFWINPAVISSVAAALQAGTPLDLDELAAAEPVNLFAGHAVNAIAVEVPSSLLGTGQQQAGFWATTSVKDITGGSWLQIQRVGWPLIPTLFMAPDSELASAYQSGGPDKDLERYGAHIAGLASRLAELTGAAGSPRQHGDDVRDRLLPDMLPYRPGTPAMFGFGEVNGRGLADPATEVMIRIVTGHDISLGIGPESAGQLQPAFPYLTPVLNGA